jgi:3'-phosphoadenosine 5'-phosphosulfate sulfotransferase (PAPS reductase)/FAD synthetase
MLFPQVSADLSVRWCSAYLKIDVAALSISNDPWFKGSRKVLYLSGERRQESSARSRYAEMEQHRTATAPAGWITGGPSSTSPRNRCGA